MTYIKVCGVTRAQDAEAAAKAGANFIGLIFSPHSLRSITLEQGKAIAAAARNFGAKPVAVFTDTPLREMEDIANLLDIRLIQLHSDYAIVEGAQLSCGRIFVNPKTTEGMDKDRDFILYDSKTGDFGPYFPLAHSHWFLAGGLTPENVSRVIQNYHPPGVDVASGVEKGFPGIKDFDRIISFIKAVRSS